MTSSDKTASEAWRVLGWVPDRLVWTVRGQYAVEQDAKEHAETLEHKGIRVRVQPIIWKSSLTIKPAVNNQARTWREEQLERQIQLADTKKYYKSPG